MDGQLDIIVAEASAAFGSQILALSWVYSPCNCLDNRIPAEVAKTEAGFNEVMEMLGQIKTATIDSPKQPVPWKRKSH